MGMIEELKTAYMICHNEIEASKRTSNSGKTRRGVFKEAKRATIEC